MLTVEKLRKIATEAYENDEWICMVSGEVFEIFKCNSQEEIEEMMEDFTELEADEDDEYSVVDTKGIIYTDADHAKDWNYFKNTMGI